jgi:hypothetical protein
MEPQGGQIRVVLIIAGQKYVQEITPPPGIDCLQVGRGETIYVPRPLTDAELDKLRALGIDLRPSDDDFPKTQYLCITPNGFSDTAMPLPETPALNWCRLPPDVPVPALTVLRGDNGWYFTPSYKGPGPNDFYKLSGTSRKRCATTMTPEEIANKKQNGGHSSYTVISNQPRFLNYPWKNQEVPVSVSVEIL